MNILEVKKEDIDSQLLRRAYESLARKPTIFSRWMNGVNVLICIICLSSV